MENLEKKKTCQKSNTFSPTLHTKCLGLVREINGSSSSLTWRSISEITNNNNDNEKEGKKNDYDNNPDIDDENGEDGDKELIDQFAALIHC